MKKEEKILFYGLSDMGKQRTNNEDAFVAERLDQNTVLAVAIDGVGGYEGGEVAADIARTEIPKYLNQFRNGERIELLKQAVVSANNTIFERRRTDTERANMSCVLTSALIDTKRKIIDMVHVGDTRMYQYHYGELVKFSHDHSLVGYREEVGDLTEEQAMHHPQRNVISRDVGSALHEANDRDFIEAEEFPLLPNSILLLCSDGLTDVITSQQIKDILGLTSALEKKAEKLIEAANNAGGKDNITVVLVEYTVKEEKIGITSPTNNVQKDIQLTEKTDTGEKVSRKNSNTIYLLIIILLVLLLAIFSGICVLL